MKKEKRMIADDHRWNWIDYAFFCACCASAIFSCWALSKGLTFLWSLLRG